MVGDDLGYAGVEVLEIQRHRAAGGVFRQHLALVRADCHVDAEALGRGQEVADPVRGRRHQQQEAPFSVVVGHGASPRSVRMQGVASLLPEVRVWPEADPFESG